MRRRRRVAPTAAAGRDDECPEQNDCAHDPSLAAMRNGYCSLRSAGPSSCLVVSTPS
jgi:hypothetical protein